MPPDTTTVPLTDKERISAGKKPPLVLVLTAPVEFDERTITQLVLRSSAKALRGFSVEVTPEGGMKYEPWELGLVGMKMAGEPSQVLEKMDMMDVQALAQAVMGFIVPGLKTGSAPSQ